MINFILAATVNGGIGLNNRLPWHYSEDMKVFKVLTLNSNVLMGRKTYESLPSKGLPGRNVFVLSAVSNTTARAGHFSCVAEAISYAKAKSVEDHSFTMWVIGGAQVFKSFSADFDYAHLTVVHDNYKCDTFYNVYEASIFKEIYQQHSVKHKDVLEYRLLYNARSHNARNREFELRCQKAVETLINDKQLQTV